MKFTLQAGYPPRLPKRLLALASKKRSVRIVHEIFRTELAPVDEADIGGLGLRLMSARKKILV